jgi:hypothetical protein
VWVKGKRTFEQLDSVAPGGFVKIVRQQNCFAPRRQIDRVRIFGLFAYRPKAFRLDEFLSKRMGETGDDFELQLTDVAPFALETVGPHMGPRLGRNELRVDFNRLASATHTAFEQIAYAEFATDLFRIDGFALVSERRISGDDEAIGYARKVSRQIVRDGVDEIFLIGIAAQVLKTVALRLKALARSRACL